jgi:hypothetical protein
MKILAYLVVAGLAAQPLAAQLQMSSLDGLAAKAKESVEITLDAATLKLANSVLGGIGDKATSEAASKLLATLKGITVRAYEFTSEGQYDAKVLQTFRDQLRGQGWTRMLDMKDGKESFELYSKSEQGKSAGFALIAAEAKELAIVHIDGPLDLAQLASLSGQFGIPKLPIPGVIKTEKGKE